MLIIPWIHFACWKGKGLTVIVSRMTIQFMAPLFGSIPSSVWVRELSSKFSLRLTPSHTERWRECQPRSKHYIPANAFYNIVSFWVRDTKVFLHVHLTHRESPCCILLCIFQHEWRHSQLFIAKVTRLFCYKYYFLDCKHYKAVMSAFTRIPKGDF